jgi:serine/threonine-protein kinase
MADVYQARDASGRQVALKLLRAPDDPEHLGFVEDRFETETRVLMRLRHPGIVRGLGHGQTAEGTRWLTMEWVAGRDLATLYREDQPPPERVLRLVVQVARAVAHAHAHGVVHRDLKASNILVGADDHVTVLDFGLAKVGQAPESGSGRVLGSAHSIAPEQVSGASVDHRADVYGLGVLLYRGLVGRYPFHGRQAVEILAAHMHRDVPAFARYRPELRLPEGLEGTVRRCLAKRPEDRFSDADTLISDLDDYIERLQTPAVWTPPRRYRRSLWSAVAVLALAVSTLAWWL